MNKINAFILKKLGIQSLKKQTVDLEKQNIQLQAMLKKLEKQVADNKRAVERDKRTYLYKLNNLEAYMFSQNKGLSSQKRTPRVVVSLTSFPPRMAHVPVAIECMLVQTMRPDVIVLWLSKEQFPNREADLPQQLLDLLTYGVEIKWCDGDIRSYKKILPALEEYPDDLIITIDDDLLYKVDFIENLYKAHLEFPQEIIASRVHEIAIDQGGKIAPYSVWKKECGFDLYEKKDNWFFTSGAGTLFPPHIFTKEIMNLDVIQELCPHADDVWLNIHASIQGVSIINTANNNDLYYIEGSQDQRLWDINKEQNDVQISKLAMHYAEQLKNTIYSKV